MKTKLFERVDLYRTMNNDYSSVTIKFVKYLILNSLPQSSIKPNKEVFITNFSKMKANKYQYHEIQLIVARFYQDFYNLGLLKILSMLVTILSGK